jgi:hypothetical protein
MKVQFTMDQELARFELPAAVQERLEALLDRQDRGEPLCEAERREAEGLVEMAEFLSLLRLRAERTSSSPASRVGFPSGCVARSSSARSSDASIVNSRSRGRLPLSRRSHRAGRCRRTDDAGQPGPCCVSCSLRKAARQRAPDPQSGESVHLYHPRRIAWDDHFRWDGVHIRGLTARGRATVAALKTNRPLMVAIRREEVALGRHPQG